MSVLELAAPRVSPTYTITDLPQLKEDILSQDQRDVFNRIYRIRTERKKIGFLTHTAQSQMARRLNEEFDDICFNTATIVKHKVLVGEEASFNPRRANRPIQKLTGNPTQLLREKNPSENCPFCPHNQHLQPFDPSIGFFEGEQSVVYANPASYVADHNLVIPKSAHYPEQYTREVFTDMINTAYKYFMRANEEDPEEIYPLIGHNMFPRAGASVYHPHLQLLLTKEPYERVEKERDNMGFYHMVNRFPFLDDLTFPLRKLGLVADRGSSHIIFELTPKNDYGVLVYANETGNSPGQDFANALFDVIEWYRNLGVTSFNMAIFMPPINESIRNSRWHNFFPYARFVGRGSEDMQTSDFAVMESLVGAPVITTDPFKLAQSFEEYYSSKSTLLTL